MRDHYPRGARLIALEKNVLKRRAFEMILVLFYVEDLKDFLASLIRMNAGLKLAISAATQQLPKGKKGEFKAIWQILVERKIITDEESLEIQSLIDYRNLIAHQTHQLTSDIGRNLIAVNCEALASFEPSALRRVQQYREKILGGMPSNYIYPARIREEMFKAASKTYKEELKRLSGKIQKQVALVRRETCEINAAIDRLPSELIARLEPGHPDQLTRNGTLTEKGLVCAVSLFDAGASPLVVAYLMRLSLRVTNIRYRAWYARKVVT